MASLLDTARSCPHPGQRVRAAGKGEGGSGPLHSHLGTQLALGRPWRPLSPAREQIGRVLGLTGLDPWNMLEGMQSALGPGMC